MKRAAESKLFLMTSLPAVDGTLFALAATGRLATPAVAVTVGLTIIAGAGAWLSAREEFSGERGGDRGTLLFIALASTLLALAATTAGALVGAHVTLVALPTAAGLALVALAAEFAGARLPRVAGLAAPTLIVIGGIAGEVIAWASP